MSPRARRPRGPERMGEHASELSPAEAREHQRLIASGDGWSCVRFALDVGGDIQALQARVIETGHAQALSLFAARVPGADVAALERRLIEVGDTFQAAMFAGNVHGADIEALQTLVLERGNAVDCSMFAEQCAKSDVKALERRVIELAEREPGVCYTFALRVEGADVEALATAVAEFGTGFDCYCMIADIPGLSDKAVEALVRRTAEVGTGFDCVLTAACTERVKDPSALQKRVLEVGTADDCRGFVLHVPGANTERLEARAAALEGVEDEAGAELAP